MAGNDKDPPGRDGDRGSDRGSDRGKDAPGRDRSWKDGKEDGSAHPSELGALNAAHASEQALANAAPDSRVGLIAAYRDEVLRTREIESRLDKVRETLDGLEPPARDVRTINADLDAARGEVDRLKGEIATLEAELEAAGGSDPALEAAIAEKEAQLADTKGAIDALHAEKEAAQEYRALQDRLAELERKLAERPAIEQAAIEAAANKPVTEEVVDAVRDLLGLN
jgi:chromosome segregation ATPase